MVKIAGGRGDRFAELLLACGLSVGELAKLLGKKPASVARWGEKVPQYALAYLELLFETKPYARYSDLDK